MIHAMAAVSNFAKACLHMVTQRHPLRVALILLLGIGGIAALPAIAKKPGSVNLVTGPIQIDTKPINYFQRLN